MSRIKKHISQSHWYKAPAGVRGMGFELGQIDEVGSIPKVRGLFNP